MAFIGCIQNFDQKTGQPAKLSPEQEAASRCFAVLMLVSECCSEIVHNAVSGKTEENGRLLGEMLDSLLTTCGGGGQIHLDTLRLAKLVGCQLRVEVGQNPTQEGTAT